MFEVQYVYIKSNLTSKWYQNNLLLVEIASSSFRGKHSGTLALEALGQGEQLM